MAERGEKFWTGQELNLASFEPQWFSSASVQNSRQDYTMNGELDQSLEKTLGNHLCLAGPMIDSYFKEIGRAMYEKLRRSYLTIFDPLQVMPECVLDMGWI